VFYVAGPAEIWGPFLVVFLVLAWIRTDLAAASVIVFLPYFMEPKHIGSHPLPPSEVLLGCVAIVTVARALTPFLAPRLRVHIKLGTAPSVQTLRESPFVLPGLLFFVAAAISTGAATELHLAARALLEVVLEPVMLFVLLICNLPAGSPGGRRRSLTLLGLALVLAGAGPAAVGIVQLVTHTSLVAIPGAGYERIRSVYGSPDNLGLLLDRAIPMASALLLTPLALPLIGSLSGDRVHSNDRLRVIVGAVALIAFLLTVVALVSTFVLGAWIASFVGALLVFLTRLKAGWWLLIVLAVVFVGGLTVGRSHLAHGFSSAHGVTAAQRLRIWRSSLRMIRDHPIVGVGPDNFRHYYTPRHQSQHECPPGLGYMEPAAWREPCLSHPHNVFLDFWLSTGVVGLVAFGWLQVVFWRIVWRSRSLLARDLLPLLGAAGAMLAGLVHGLVDNSYFLVDLSAITWVLFAIASLASAPLARSEDPC